jgi:hypothetical protein
MKKTISVLLFAALLLSATGCKDYLDINTNPNFPQQVEPVVLVPPMQAQMALSVQFDGRFVGKYIQNFVQSTSGNTWDRHGYDPGSDNGGQIWRMAYFDIGQNLNLMLEGAEKGQKWDMVGMGKAMRAWSWQMATHMHGEIILSQAFDQSLRTFEYDDQPTVYTEVVRLGEEAISYLERTDGGVSQQYMGRGDKIYNGDPTKWIKFVNGLLARNANNLVNKASYNPDKVIEYADKAMTSINDDALVPFNGSNTADASFFGPLRGNLTNFRQSNYIVSLMDGTVFGGVKDPRLPGLLVPSADSVFRGLAPNASEVTTASVRIPNPWGVVGAPPAGAIGKYLFRNNAPFPIMTYAEMQFIKAEAAFIKGDKATALGAYTNGIAAHMDFVNKYVLETNQRVSPADLAAYLANPAVVPASADELTLSQIMLQKYIAMYGYGFVETWNDMRKYHYSPEVYTGFTLPSQLYPDNNGKPAYRVRPRYNSEYIWNLETLKKLNGDQPDYHTYEMWFSQP